MATGFCSDDCKNYKDCPHDAKGSTKVGNCRDFEEN